MKKVIPDEKFGFVNADRACQILGVSKSWLYKATSRCTLKHFKIGNKLLFKIDELLEFVEANRTETVQQTNAYRYPKGVQVFCKQDFFNLVERYAKIGK